MKIAINGLGRIGKNFLCALLEDKEAQKKLSIAAINIGPALLEHVPHFLKYDTTLGTCKDAIFLEKPNILHINDHVIPLFAHTDPLNLNWGSLEIDWVVDCSGKFTQKKDAYMHCDAGARKVLVSAPMEDADVWIVPGVNMHDYSAQKHAIISLGSCTTNAFLPILKVLDDAFCLEHVCMTTVHAYTNSQALLDSFGKDLRRSRAAALNIIPTNTGAARMVGRIMPHLANKVIARAIRVPIGNVSLIDIVFLPKKSCSDKEINQALEHASTTLLKNIMGFSKEPLVSSDFIKNSHSVILDSLLTKSEGLGQVFGWYDNEWAYSVRLKDFLLFAASCS